MAGLAGFEPTNDGTKTRCLTTWRQPKLVIFYHKNPPNTRGIFALRVFNTVNPQNNNNFIIPQAE